MNQKVDSGVELDTEDLEQAVADQLGQVDAAAQQTMADNEEGTPLEPDPEKDTLLLYKSKCLNCAHLFPEGAKKIYNSCHYSKGNEDCPARSLKIVVMIPADKVSNMLVEATLANDVVRLSELTARLNKSDPAEVERTMALFRQKIANVQNGSKA